MKDKYFVLILLLLFVQSFAPTSLAQTPLLQPPSKYWKSIQDSRSGGLMQLYVDESAPAKVISLVYSAEPESIVDLMSMLERRELESLLHICFYQTTITGNLLRKFRGLGQIRSVEAESCLYHKNAFHNLEHLHSLRELAIEEGNGREIDDWSFLGRLENLELLRINSPGLNDQALRIIGECRRLRRLEFTAEPGVSSEMLAAILRLNSLEELRLHYTTELDGLLASALKECKARVLSIPLNEAPASELAAIFCMPNLRELWLFRMPANLDLSGVPASESIYHLSVHFESDTLSDDSLGFLVKLPNLQSFTCFNHSDFPTQSLLAVPSLLKVTIPNARNAEDSLEKLQAELLERAD